MKVCVIQPAHAVDYARSDDFLKKELRQLSQCDSSVDLIVLPQSCDIPCLAHTCQETETFLKMGIDVILSNDYTRIAQTVTNFR